MDFWPGTLATSYKELTCWKRRWCWGGLGAGGEGDDREWDGWMASWTRWTWIWVNSGSWWWTGRPGVLRFMGSQRIRHDWATELTDYKYALSLWLCLQINIIHLFIGILLWTDIPPFLWCHKKERFSLHTSRRILSRRCDFNIWLTNLGETTEHAFPGATWAFSSSWQASSCSNLPPSIQKESVAVSEAHGCPDCLWLGW